MELEKCMLSEINQAQKGKYNRYHAHSEKSYVV
jgi:hypothetical protein